MYRVKFRTLLTAVAAVSWSTFAFAADVLVLDVDKTTMMELNGVPGAVVIANPIIADVTIQGNKMFLLGRSFGTTNIIILDQQGQELQSFDVSVRLETDNLLSVFKMGNRFSFNCAPTCQNEVQVGDNEDFNAVTVGQIERKLKVATGNSDTSSEAPPAPQ